MYLRRVQQLSSQARRVDDPTSLATSRYRQLHIARNISLVRPLDPCPVHARYDPDKDNRAVLPTRVYVERSLSV